MAGLIGPRLYSCSNCRNTVALHDDIVSKAFQTRRVERCGGILGSRFYFKTEKVLAKELPLARLPKHVKTALVLPKERSVVGRNSRAFLFSHAMNVDVGPKEDRHLMTGLHTVADVYCTDCREVLGWKYERAYEESQKYKEGKYILEKSKIVKDNW